VTNHLNEIGGGIGGGTKTKAKADIDFPNSFIEKGKVFRIKSSLGGYLHVQGEAENGTPITLWNKTGLDSNPISFKWFVTKTNGGYHLRSIKGSGEFALHLHGNTSNNGDKCTIWNISANQSNLVLNFEKTVDGFYLFKFLHSGKYVQLNANATADGTGIIQWDNDNSGGFKWEIEKVKGEKWKAPKVSGGISGGIKIGGDFKGKKKRLKKLFFIQYSKGNKKKKGGIGLDINIGGGIGGKGKVKGKKGSKSSSSTDSKGNKKKKRRNRIGYQIGGGAKVDGDIKIKTKTEGEVKVEDEIVEVYVRYVMRVPKPELSQYKDKLEAEAKKALKKFAGTEVHGHTGRRLYGTTNVRASSEVVMDFEIEGSGKAGKY